MLGHAAMISYMQFCLSLKLYKTRVWLCTQKFLCDVNKTNYCSKGGTIRLFYYHLPSIVIMIMLDHYNMLVSSSLTGIFQPRIEFPLEWLESRNLLLMFQLITPVILRVEWSEEWSEDPWGWLVQLVKMSAKEFHFQREILSYNFWYNSLLNKASLITVNTIWVWNHVLYTNATYICNWMYEAHINKMSCSAVVMYNMAVLVYPL